MWKLEKRNVVIDDEKTKTASEGSVCPHCGNKLKEASFCETCGTEPFEKRPEKEKEKKQ